MRDDALTRVGERGLGCTVNRVTQGPDGNTWRMVKGTFTVPLYVESEHEGSRATRDGDGHVRFNRLGEAPFTLMIPNSVHASLEAGGPPGRTMVFGHGLLGEADNVTDPGGTRTLDRFSVVAVATDEWGLSTPDQNTIINDVVTDFSNFEMVTDRLMQAVINFVVLARSMKGVCSELPELQIAGRPALDTEHVYYYGVSNGAILGGSIAGMSPDIEGYVLHVGGISYPLMIRRSLDFHPFEIVFRLWYPSKIERDWILVATASLWDTAEPATFAPHLLNDPLPGSRAVRVLLQASRYDAEVSNVSSDVAARTMGLDWFRSSVYEPWNVAATDGPADSGYVIYHVRGVAPISPGARPPDRNNIAHTALYVQEAAVLQLDRFMHPEGQVENFCDGSCDPN